MSKKRVLILVPARFSSTRFPGKPLALINNQSMISMVMKNMSEIKHSDIDFESFAVTDDSRIEEHLKELNLNVVRVDDDVISGTLRIELAYSRFFKEKKFDLIINVQGDEPLLLGEEIVKLAMFHLQGPFDISTMVKKNIGFGADFLDSNKVKVVMSEVNGRALYFSRASIPYKRDQGQDLNDDYWFLHIGVYSYTPNALSAFAKADVSRLENLEKLEQLRALEIGLSLGAIETKSIIMGVDHPDDVKKIEEVLNARK